NTVNTAVDSPYRQELDHAFDQLNTFKSPLSPMLPVDADVPILQMQGFTDPLFKPVEAAQIRAKVKGFDPAYPISTEYGDVGHSYAGNDPSAWSHFNARANAFFDFELLRSGTAPAFDVEASLTRCRAPSDSARTVTAPTFAGLSTGTVTLTST